jgi:SpoVK/Ycf46/Vps4 family AAA+-type ATPase
MNSASLQRLSKVSCVRTNTAYLCMPGGGYAKFTKRGSSDGIWLKCTTDLDLDKSVVCIPAIHRLADWQDDDTIDIEWASWVDFKTQVPTATYITCTVVKGSGAAYDGPHMRDVDVENIVKETLALKPIRIDEKFSCSIKGSLYAIRIDKIETKNGKMPAGLSVKQGFCDKDVSIFNISLGYVSRNGSDNVDDENKYSTSDRKSKEDFSHVTKLMSEDMDFSQYGIGGLNKELTEVFRRAFISRRFTQEQLDKMDCKHVKGVLLYGLPGCGKTLIARKMAEILKISEPTVVNGPEILNSYVGQSEANMRKLFTPADANPNKVHVIIMDEIDAICKERSGGSGAGERVSDGLVNTLLTELDGVKARNNIFVIGMTNKRELIDKALLRPGRLEIQIEIGLPDKAGREAIFSVHTKKMKANGYLDDLVDIKLLADATVNFTGAEIAGLIRSAQSFAMMESVRNELHEVKDNSGVNMNGNTNQKILVSNQHFELALNEIRPAFGIAREKWSNYQLGGFIGSAPSALVEWCDKPIKSSMRTLLIHGAHGTGCTATASYIAEKCKTFNFVRWLSASKILHMSEHSKAKLLRDTFENAFCCDRSLIVIDDLEEWMEYINGARFSSYLFKQLLNLCRQQPANGKECVLVCTTHEYEFFTAIGGADIFLKKEELSLIMDLTDVCNKFPNVEFSNVELPISVKNLVNTYGLTR